MSIRVTLCFTLFLAGLQTYATTFTVKSAGGGNYKTIQACANAMSPGDTCTVYAGTYGENVTITAGNVGAYKTLQVNGSDVVNVLGFSLNSHTKLIGFHISNPNSPSSSLCVGIPSGSTDIYVIGNSLYACGNGNAAILGANASYIYVQNNAISYPCTTNKPPTDPCVGIESTGNSNHWLVEKNDISHSVRGIVFEGSYNIFRGNNYHDNIESECMVGSHGSNCHLDLLFTEPTSATQFNLAEGNICLNNFGPNAKGYLAQANVCPTGQCHHLIIRYNVGAHAGSGGIIDDNAFDKSAPGFSHVKSYNNTWVDFNQNNPLYGGTNAFTNNSTNGANINDIFYYAQALVSFNPYFDDATTHQTFAYRNNLAFCSTDGVNVASQCTLYNHTYSTGNLDFTADPGNIKANPKFVNYAGNDFHLSPTSPAIGAGSYLTTVAAGDSRSGTTLLVNDVGFFQDGYGMSGVSRDQIRVGTSAVVQITSIDYTNNILVLAKSITRSPGDPVYLFSDSNGRVVLTGKAPDLGALPSQSQQTLAAPTGLQAAVN